jgi:hypothetical protein
LSNNGAVESQEISVSSTARICAITRVRLGANESAANGFNGWLDAFRFIRAATVTSTETPSANAPTIIDYPIHFFSIPEMKMYEATAASASAGSNPTFTQRNRLFIGELDTGAATVSAVRNYALRGQYRSIQSSMPAQNTVGTYSHNIGAPCRAKFSVKVTTSFGIGTGDYLVGEEVAINFSSGDSTSPRTANSISTTRNTVKLRNDNAGGIGATLLSGSRTTFVTTSTPLIVEVKRIF